MKLAFILIWKLWTVYARMYARPSCHASLKFVGYSNLQNGDILKMSNLKLSQPGVKFSWVNVCCEDVFFSLPVTEEKYVQIYLALLECKVFGKPFRSDQWLYFTVYSLSCGFRLSTSIDRP